MAEALDALDLLVREHLEREAAVPVRAPLDPADAVRDLDLTLSEAPMPFDEVVERLRHILAATPRTASPRFFNQLFGGRDAAAVLGDTLATVLNNSVYTYKVGGPHVLIELELVRRMGALMGFADPEGVFVPGGSMSNLCGLVVARGEALPDLRDEGGDGRRGRVYTSIDSHYSVRKAAGIIGLGRRNVIDIAVDGEGRMDPAALAAAIDADLAAGHVPVAVNATTGTTVQGAFDPVDAIADVCAERGVWLHVDAAYGGSMVFHPELAHHFQALHRADSITWDPHKMMGVPLTCSVIMVRQKGLLTKHFDETAPYLFQDDSDALNPGTRSPQCGRRNATLKLWTAWKTHGDQGYAERMIRLRELALYARDRVKADPELGLMREPQSLNVCFKVDGVDPVVLCTELNRQGRAMVGHAHVDGEAVVRVVFLDPHTSEADLDVFFAEVATVAAELRAAGRAP